MGQCEPAEVPPPPSALPQHQIAASPAPTSDAGVCTTGAVELQRRRLDIYMMVDDSSVMVLVWQDTLSAIDAFITDPSSAGIGVGLQFFGTSCDAASYAVPRVPIELLPENVPALETAFPVVPADKNAALPAVQGAVMYAKTWAKRYPDRDVAVLLLTAGLPLECDSTVDKVSQVARDANESHPTVPTYVVVFGFIGAVNVFASAGGTGESKVVAPGSAIELQQALNDVRNDARSCSFGLSETLQADLRANRLEIEHIHSDGALAGVPPVADAASCDVQLGGWYPDDAGAPTSIVLCPQSCLRLGSDRLQAAGCPYR